MILPCKGHWHSIHQSPLGPATVAPLTTPLTLREPSFGGTCREKGWLVGWLVGWLDGWLVGWLVGWWLIEC